MCTVSMIVDGYRDTLPKWIPIVPNTFIPGDTAPITIPDYVTPEEVRALRDEVKELKKLLEAAKAFDEATGQPDCETEDKVGLLRALARALGVDLDDVLAPARAG